MRGLLAVALVQISHCVAAGHCTILVTRRVNEGATVHSLSLIGAVNNAWSPRCRVGVDLASRGRRPLRNIGNPTCQRGSYSARSIAH